MINIVLKHVYYKNSSVDFAQIDIGKKLVYYKNSSINFAQTITHRSQQCFHIEDDLGQILFLTFQIRGDSLVRVGYHLRLLVSLSICGWIKLASKKLCHIIY